MKGFTGNQGKRTSYKWFEKGGLEIKLHVFEDSDKNRRLILTLIIPQRTRDKVDALFISTVCIESKVNRGQGKASFLIVKFLLNLSL